MQYYVTSRCACTYSKPVKLIFVQQELWTFSSYIDEISNLKLSSLECDVVIGATPPRASLAEVLHRSSDTESPLRASGYIHRGEQE